MSDNQNLKLVTIVVKKEHGNTRNHEIVITHGLQVRNFFDDSNLLIANPMGSILARLEDGLEIQEDDFLYQASIVEEKPPMNLANVKAYLAFPKKQSAPIVSTELLLLIAHQDGIFAWKEKDFPFNLHDPKEVLDWRRDQKNGINCISWALIVLQNGMDIKILNKTFRNNGGVLRELN
ncbi:MAG: hypothetical protein US24_C0004G0019 [candidate division WS6 bacterium GW2011_GWC2_36_7]|uniref:Uncharacterized protein n=1 Tax=candidate division WS6 bacterium GW2011_GWC2_36_7 TaxID=1619091 RepID=A0A0G0EZ51_9BACT|nr:MAG: hypothetical protein US24_C0004G0019 [candidate division WS6 bacterium GW2011_GWC2_36_7]